MAHETMYPILPCRDLDESIGFYEAMGFERTYRQQRPNPFDPATSHGNVIVAVPDPDALCADFAAGLRAVRGKLPSTGIPRILRPRKRFGTVRGFSVVDPGGNWLRISKAGDTEEAAAEDRSTGLARVIDNAARQGDARGDDPAALDLLEHGLVRFPDAPSLAAARAVDLGSDERAAVVDELDHAVTLVWEATS